MARSVAPERTAITATAQSGAPSLLPGWNLVSLPRQPADPAPASVFASLAGSLSRVYAWDACDSADPWKVYDPADPAGSDLTAVSSTQGLWIEMLAAAPLPTEGDEPAVTTIHLCSGWNLIGFPANSPRTVESALAPVAGSYSRLFGHDPADPSDPWELHDVSIPSWANDLTHLQPGRGYWILATANAELPISRKPSPVQVALASPADLSVITAPTGVVGTVAGDSLARWSLSMRAEGEETWTQLASGTSAVANGRLGTFDPTLLLNGAYEIELAATDTQGETTSIEADFQIEGQMKIGLFSLTFSDLEVALAGLPIEILRTYDSRARQKGDFGAGWSLALRQGSYRNNRQPGDGWQFGQSFLPCDTPGATRSHQTTIRLSDNEIYRFRLALFQGVPTLGGCFGRARFDFVDGPMPGATLAILGNEQVLYRNGANEVLDPDTLETYEPRQVRLTTRDGRVFDLDLAQGVTRVADPSGNALSITPSGIIHTSGRTVVFERDGQGRITRITDPDGASLIYVYDSAGDLVEARDREGHSTRFTYDNRHLLLEIENALGVKAVRNEYDAEGRLVRHVDALGKTIEYDHRLSERQELITDRLQQTRLLEYDSRGNVVREVDAAGAETRRTFDEKDHLISETDPLGHTTTLTWDSAGNLTRFEGPLGHPMALAYDGRGEVVRATDPLGHSEEYGYDARGNLTLIRDAAGNETRFGIDSRGLVVRETDAQGGTTSFEHDAFGRVQRKVDTLGHENLFTWDGSGRLLTESMTRTLPGGGTETITSSRRYNASGQPVEIVRPDGGSEKIVYDELGRVRETEDPSGKRIAFRYDDLGRKVATVSPDGKEEKRTYDAEGRLIRLEDRAGRATTFSYDPVGRLLETVHPDGTATRSVYDSAGRLVRATDARGHEVQSVYDAAGRLVRSTGPLGTRTDLEYDAAGNQTAVTGPDGLTVRFTYDDLDRLVRTVFADGSEERTTYDTLGRQTATTDTAGRTTRYTYDPLGQLTAVTDPLGTITSYAYDELGQRIAQTDALERTTRFDYDSLGRLIRRVLPDGSAEEVSYDPAGRLLTRKDFAGRVTSYAYDTNGRLSQRTAPDGSSASFRYTATGQREAAIDSRGETLWRYDDRDRILEQRLPDGRSLSYTYDANGNRTSLIARVAGQDWQVLYRYDDRNRLIEVVDPRGRSYAVSYDASGNRTGLAFPNGTQTSYRYDSLHRLVEQTSRRTAAGEIFQSFLYTRGPAGHRLRIDEAGGTTRSYGYDGLFRLASESVSRANVIVDARTFTYDAVGNRLQQDRTTDDGAVTVHSTYDSRDRLLSAGDLAFTWDANGNLTGRGDTSFAWSSENRLTEARLADGSRVAHHYDADGARIRTVREKPGESPEIRDLLVDSAGGLPQVVAETDAGGALVAFYVRGDELLAVLRPTGDRFVHLDALGSLRELTDETGQVTDHYEWTAFGELLSHEGDDPGEILFAGEWLDRATGLYDLRARWMDPTTGRFLGMDPFEGLPESPSTLHRYLYAQADPVNATDPTGLFTAVEMGVADTIRAIHFQITSDTGFNLIEGAQNGGHVSMFSLYSGIALGAAIHGTPVFIQGVKKVFGTVGKAEGVIRAFRTLKVIKVFKPGGGGLTREALDVIWELYSTLRGLAIQADLARTEYKNATHVGAWWHGFFPIFDFIEDTKAISLKTTAVADRAQAISELTREIDRIAEKGGDFLRSRGFNIDQYILDVRVPTGKAAELQDLVEIGTRRGVIVEIIEYP